MTTRVIQREFVVQTGVDALTPVTLDERWSTFMNTYAVWEGTENSITIRRSIALQAGNYYITGAVDNSGTLTINGKNNVPLYGFSTAISRTATGNSTVVNHPGGNMDIVITAINTGGPRGVAVTISEYKQDVINTQSPAEIYRDGYRNTLSAPYVGDLVWSTRNPGTQDAGRYRVAMPFRARITAHAWGGGGGGGGMDSGTQGGVGASGLYNSTTFEVDKDDTLEVFVGRFGRGAGSSSSNAAGGAAGSSRIQISGDSEKSFNGGTGGTAGPSGTSGGGGGGGGASGILVNNIPVLVAAGGGGGGGAGNDGNGSDRIARRTAAITNNAIGDYAIGVRALNIDNASSFTINAGAQVNTYTNFGSLSAPPAATGTSKVIVFGWGSIPANAQTRTITTNSKINLSSSNALTFYVNKGTESDWGQIPDSGEDLHLEYSTDGSTWVKITTVLRNVARNTWLIQSPQIPAGAKVAGGVFLRFRQTTQASSSSGKRDTWAISGIWNGSLTLDFRGENGQTKTGDGGGGGGAGGGYPGGQGGAVPGGDTSAFAGSCGGNFPDNVGATTGSNTTYYKTGFAAGGNIGGGNGQSGRVVLLIEPISLVSVKVSGEWKQIPEAFVKVAGTWRDIETIYVKINNTWRDINGVGQGDVTLPVLLGSYGTSARSFS